MILDVKKYFYFIAKSLGNDWKELAGVMYNNLDVDVIQCELPHSLYDQARKFLELWYRYNYPYVSMRQLHQALQQIGRNDIATKINSER